MCLLKKDRTPYPSDSINNLLNACQCIIRIHQRSQTPYLLASGLPVLPRLNIWMHPLFARIVDCFEAAMRKSIKEQGNTPRQKVDMFNIDQEKLILSHPEHSIHSNISLQKRWAFYC
jgi:hypothetical protein